jgi:23S rRNA pseudouridine1911/1915/1917 synthase
MDHHDLRVSAEQSGVRLDQFLVGELPGHSRSRFQRLIKDGLVQVAGRAAKANYVVRPGDAITVEVPEPAPATPEPEPLPLDVLFEDADIIVVNKAAGMVVHPAPGHGGGTLVNALLHHVDDLSGVGGELRPGIVHRLDRGTSGVMVVAKHDASHREMARQFHDREVEKEYEALVWGPCTKAAASTRRSGATRTTARRCRTAPGSRGRRSRASRLRGSSTACRICTSPSRRAGRTRSACT